MEETVLSLGEAPKILIREISGKLRITGREEEEIQAIVTEPDVLSKSIKANKVEMSCASDCTLLVPHSSQIEVRKIVAETNINGVKGDLLIRTVGADLHLRNVGPTAIESAGGKIEAFKVEGSFSVDQCGGGVQLGYIEGDVRLRRLGGDLYAENISGLLEANVGGDASVGLSPPGGSKSSITAGGEIICHLPEDASVKVKLVAGGDVRFAISEEAQSSTDGFEVKLGDGGAELNLIAGGNLVLRTGDEGVEGMGMNLGAAIAARVAAEMEAEMAELDERLSSLGAGLDHFDSEKISRKVRASIARAQRKAEHARHKAARRARRRAARKLSGDVSFGRPSSRQQSTEEERRMILNMIEEGKISVEEAEKLFEALEG